MSLINTNAINRLLIPGIEAVWGMARDYGDQFTAIYGPAIKSDLNQEFDLEMKYTGAADVTDEGAPIASDSMYQTFISTYSHRKVTQSFQMTLEAIQDNLYQRDFPQRSMALKQSMITTKNIIGADVLNNAFNPNYPMSDGLPLCSNAHKIQNGTFSNTSTGLTVDFSEAGIEDGIITIQQFKTQAGIPEQVRDKKILISRNDQFAAKRILQSEFQNNTANNAINALKNGYMYDGYTYNQFLIGNSWFILTDASDGFKHFNRMSVAFDTYTDFSTDVVSMKAVERYSMGVTNVRAVYGSNVL